MKLEIHTKEIITNASEAKLYNALIEATNIAGATVYQTGKHSFYPAGFTAFVILGESHSSLHYFYEDQSVFVELAISSRKYINVDKFFVELERLIQ